MSWAKQNAEKTHEFSLQVRNLKHAGKFAFFLPLEQLHEHSVDEVLMPKDENLLRDWLARSDDEPAWFFLDAVDELKLRNGHFRIALRKLQRTIQDRVDLAHIFVSCRPADWNQQIDLSEFAEVFPIDIEVPRAPEAMEPRSPEVIFTDTLRVDVPEHQEAEHKEVEEGPHHNQPIVYVLLPLSPDEVIEFALQIDSSKADGLREEIDRIEAWPLFQTPSDIIDGLAQLDATGRLGSLEEQVATGIDIKLREKPSRPSGTRLSLEKAREGAQRLALALVLTKRRSMLIHGAHGQTDGEKRLLHVDEVLTDWSSEEQKELLSRGLFDPSGVDSIRFHHRSTQEYLAAKRLCSHLANGFPVRDLMQLLFANQWGEKVVIPFMEPIVAWLALWNMDVFNEVKTRKPEILFRQGIPSSLSIQKRSALLAKFVENHEGRDWRGVGVDLNDVRRLGHQEMSSEIRKLWNTAYTGYSTCELLLELILFTPIPSCVDLAFSAAFDEDLPVHHRVYACRAVLKMGSEEQKRAIGRALLKETWPSRIVYETIPDLLPGVLSTSELVQIAKETDELPNEIHGLRDALRTLIHEADLDVEQLRDLRRQLSQEVWEHRSGDSSAWQAQSDFEHFTDAILAGCNRDKRIADHRTVRKWTRDAVIGLHFGDRKQSVSARKDAEAVLSRIRENTDLREAYYWARLDFDVSLVEEPTPWGRYVNVDHDNALDQITESDFPWLFKALEDTTFPQRRQVAFFAIMMAWRLNKDCEVALRVRGLISDLPQLISEYDRFLNPPKSSRSRNLGT